MEGGLRALRKKKRTGKSLLGCLMGLFYGGDIDRASPSKFRLGRIGRCMFKKMMKAKRVATFIEKAQQADVTLFV